jgi:WD40 repeat protein
MFACAFSPDGKLLLTSCSDKSACLWELETGREMANYEHADLVRAAAFSPCGNFICTGCDDREARIWKVEDKPVITDSVRSFKHQDWVVCVAYSQQGSLLCTVSRNSQVMIHDVVDYVRERRPSKRKTASLAGLAVAVTTKGSVFDEDADSRAASKARKESKESMGVLSRQESKRSSVHPDERVSEKVPHDDQTFFASFSRCAELLVTAGGWEQGNAIIFDVLSMEELLRIPHRDWVTSCRIHPFGGQILTTCRDRTARVFQLPKGMQYGSALQAAKARKEELEQEAKEAQAGQKVLRMSKKKQKELAEAAERAKIGEALRAEEVFAFTQDNWTLCAAWSPDGTRICTGSDSGCVQIFDAKTGERLLALQQKEQILDIGWSPTNRKICVASTDSTARLYGGLQTLVVQDVSDGKAAGGA